MEKDKLQLQALGNRYICEQNYRSAIACAEKLIALDFTDCDALYMAAASYMNLGEFEQAVIMAKRIVALNVDYIGAYMVLAYSYKKQFKLYEEISALEFALKIAKQSEIHTSIASEIFSLLGSAYSLLGQNKKSKECFLQSCEIEPNINQKNVEYSNYLFATNYGLDMNNDEIYTAHVKYNEFFRDVVRHQHHSIQEKTTLKIGYISPDFHQHAVVFFSYQLLANFNKNEFHVTCYSNGSSDGTTQQLKGVVSAWRDVRGLSADEAAKVIKEDEIDILVDLSGHTAHSCLPILARKPAPIQVSCIGYFNTTGLKEVDYFLTDIHCDPIGKNDDYFSEKLVRLPHSHFCYTAGSDFPEITGAACMKNGFITFGSFNNFTKVTDEVFMLWRNILERVPQSKLVLKSRAFASDYALEVVTKRLHTLGFEIARVELRPFSHDYLRQYHEIDIALDTYPYPGGATTCEALYMGVPVVTLAGNRHGSRFGYSILKNIGLDECIAYSGEEYIQKAITIASDQELLDLLHKHLRMMMLSSSLMNGQQYVAEVEQAYKKMWNQYSLLELGRNK
jgi:predicted O-linked N-acetylglucosamine transferase (SPINDLY family)